MTQERTTRGRPATIRDEDILDAARDLFKERGLGATTAEIAERASISESMIFYRFKTKEALFLAVVERQIRMPPALETLAERVGRGDLALHLYEIGSSLLESTETVLPFMMIIQSNASKFVEFQEQFKRPHPIAVKSIQLLASYLEAECRAGRLRNVDSEVLARAFLGSVIHYVMSQHMFNAADTLPLSSSVFLRGLIDILLQGALPRETKAKRR